MRWIKYGVLGMLPFALIAAWMLFAGWISGGAQWGALIAFFPVMFALFILVGYFSFGWRDEDPTYE